MTLLLDNQLLVAGDTLREISSFLVRCIKWGDHHRVNTAQCSTHSLCLRTEQIDVAVEQSLIICRGGCIDNHLASAITLRLVLLHNLSPKQTGCTELCNLHEIVLADTHIKLNALGSEVCINTSINQLLQILITPCQRIAKFLNNVGTGIIKRIGANSDTTEVGIRLENLNKLRAKCKNRRYILALHDHLCHWIPFNRTHNLLFVVALLGKEVHQDLSQFK